jgi:hypothetical protein
MLESTKGSPQWVTSVNQGHTLQQWFTEVTRYYNEEIVKKLNEYSKQLCTSRAGTEAVL